MNGAVPAINSFLANFLPSGRLHAMLKTSFAVDWRGFGMGSVKIPYYITRGENGPKTRKMGYWAPCLARRNTKTGKVEPTLMAKLGLRLVDCGPDGPQAWAIAQSWNAKWKRARADHLAGKNVTKPGKIERVFPPNSLGEGFGKFRATAEYQNKKKRTKEEWMRGWKYIEPIFGDVDPRTISLEDLDAWYNGDPKDESIKGLIELHGVGEAYRAVKYWRAIYSVLLTIKRADGERYCVGEDPTLGIRRKTPPKRQVIWIYDESRILIGAAGKMKLLGLQAALATAWDTMMSPVDVRSLTLSQMTRDAQGEIFQIDRAKTGKAAIGTLTLETQALLKAYIESLPFTLHPETPLFHTRGGQPGPKGGRPRPPAVYAKDTLSKDFRKVREAVFIGDKRTVGDFRRSGAIEVIAGQADGAALASKIANTIDSNKELQATYLPNVASVVRLADEARDRGRAVIRGVQERKGLVESKVDKEQSRK